MMKRIAFSLVILFLMSVMVGCINVREAEESVSVFNKFTGELEQNVTIYVLENDTAIEYGYFEELLKAFNAEYSDYGITAVNANMDQKLDLANDGPYGYGPDVVYQANDMIMKYVEGFHVMPLPVEQMSCFNVIPKNAWDAYKRAYEGTNFHYGIPVNIQAPMLYYRKDMLPENWEKEWDDNQNNIPDMLESWNAMYAYSKFLKESESGRYGYMKSLFDPYFSFGYLFSYGGYMFGDNNTDPSEIGFSAGEAEKGVNVLRQLAGVMNEWCIDDTITRNSYAKLADGSYFATMTTPDVYSAFLMLLTYEYEDTLGLSTEEATSHAVENLVLAGLPKLPVSGDLTEQNPELFDTKTMGGINGYAISSYTQAPNACLAFVEFATSYEMIMLRNKILGIAPVRSDAAKDSGELSVVLFENLEAGNIVIMPSNSEVAQIWTPADTFFSDVAKDPYRAENEQKYKDLQSMKTALKNVDQQIYDAIFTLSRDKGE